MLKTIFALVTVIFPINGALALWSGIAWTPMLISSLAACLAGGLALAWLGSRSVAAR